MAFLSKTKWSLVCASVWATSAYAMIEVGVPHLASHTPDGAPTAGLCLLQAVSTSGRFVGFTCLLSFDLAEGEPGQGDAFQFDIQSGILVPVGLSNANTWADCGGVELGTCASTAVAISLDGSETVLNSGAQLTPEAPPPSVDAGVPNVFLRNNDIGQTLWLTPPPPDQSLYGYPQGVDANFNSQELLFVASNNAVGGVDENGGDSDLFVKKWSTGTVELISTTPSGNQGDHSSTFGTLSTDGRYVAFLSRASNLTNDNPYNLNNIFLRDRLLNSTRRLSFPWVGGEFISQPNFQVNLQITDDDQFLFFSATGHELTEESDPSVALAFYRLNLLTNKTELISRGVDGHPLNASAFSASVSGDGNLIAYFSDATNASEALTALPTVFVQDLASGQIADAAKYFGAGSPKRSVNRLKLSEDGTTVAFDWGNFDDGSPPSLLNRQVYSVNISRTDAAVREAVPALDGWMEFILAIGLCMSGFLVRTDRIEARQGESGLQD